MATSKQGARGTGKHPDKSAAEPHPDTKDGGKGAKGADGHSGPAKRPPADGDLKGRESKDKDGNVHHTRAKSRQA